MKLYYAYTGETVTNSVQEDYDKIEDWKLINPDYILQEEVGRDNSALKQVDGVIIAKTEEEIYQEKVPSLIEALYQSYISYQNKVIDTNLKSEMEKSEVAVENGTLTVEQLPFAKENGDWLADKFWSNPDNPQENSYYDQKLKLIAGEEYNADPSIHGIPPKTFSDLRTERKGVL